ncbi:MAG: hypothetical protein BWY11_00606 [Firmicutes bacterium ADurb.Bin182]|nr:MAG: hypothetical protein BWY11_00606 [Firmicutes bacterium ADurb.Bin182]
MKKKIMLIALAITAIPILAACRQTDIIGNTSIKSFEAVIQAGGGSIAPDDQIGGWALTAPDGTSRFVWSRDFSKTEFDIMVETDVQPFINAGLDKSKLPDGMVSGDKIVVGTDLGSDELKYEGDTTPIASYEKIVELYREYIGYHAALDHYGVDLTGGNMFEWAKDMRKNDKDIVFVLDPEVFLNAGVDPAKVEGWLFAKVSKMDEKGRPVEVDKFLKPFDIK